MNVTQNLQRFAWVRGVLSAVLAFFVYGGWAFYINADHPSGIAIRSALVQGGYSFVLTLGLTTLLEFIYRALRSWKYRSSLSFAAGAVFLFATAYSINWVAGTPAIILTILPGFLIGTAYSGFYIRALRSYLS